MKKTFILLMVAMFVLLAACSKDVEKVQDKEEELVKEESSEPEKRENTFPLTGIVTNEDVTNRAVGVMVNNHRKARPQSGLSQADIVFEILAEGNITRFLALFQSEQPEVVGPVRSAREYYFELASEYDALYVFHGAANFVYDMIANKGIENLNGAIYDNDGNLFKRESFRKAPHNSYLLFDAVYEEAESNGYDIKSTYEALPFLGEEDQVTGDPANHVKIVYASNSIVEFEYNKENKKYIRYNDGEQTVELNSEEAIQVDNVFIIETNHKIIDDEGRRAVDLNSGGNAYLIQKGVTQQLQWENKDGRIIPVKEGQAVGFVPGKTWINVVPSSPGIMQSVTVSNE